MSATDLKIDTPTARESSGPVRYELIDKDGIAITGDFGSASEASEVAKHLWPDQEQDPDRTGKGYDIQVVGGDK